MVLLTGPIPVGVMELGAAMHVELAGAPVQAMVVAELNPATGVMEIVVVAALP